MNVELLKKLASKYIWWKKPEEAVHFPERVLAQVMELGDYEDMQQMVEAFGNAALCHVLQNADPGWFSPRSWTYWHYRMNPAPYGAVPALPVRKVA